MSRHHDLTDFEWELVHPLIPDPRHREDGRGRPWKEDRDVLNGILYILRTGVAWAGLPDSYPPYQTCHRRFQQWSRTGVMGNLLDTLAEVLPDQRRRRVHKALYGVTPRLEDPTGVRRANRSDNADMP